MGIDLENTVNDTVEQLEARLRRIAYVIFGHKYENKALDDASSVTVRLRGVERSLDRLIERSRVMQDLMKLHARHPDLFHNSENGDVLSSLDTTGKLSMVLATASLFPETASRLTSIHDTPMPSGELSSQLNIKASQATEVQYLQESQSREIATLKERSAVILQRWYSVDILQTGECWADIEGKIEYVERAVRRAASAKQDNQDIV